MSKCAQYWQKVEQLDNEIKDVKKELADVQRQLDSYPYTPLPQPLVKHKQVLEGKHKDLATKYKAAHLKASNCVDDD